MEDPELISLWKAYDKKLDENLVLNRKNAKDITHMKVQSLMSSMKPLKIFTILLGLAWVGFVDFLIIRLFEIASPFFLISAGIQVLLTKVAVGVYIYQLILIQRVDVDEPIVATQHKIAHLQSSTLWITRLLFLQFPVWNTFYWTESMFKNGGIIFYLIQITLTLVFTFLAIWFFRNINQKNRDKNWFKRLFAGKEWNPLIKSMILLNEIEAYRLEAKPDNPLTSPAE
ncbi:hypothetical protein ACS5NO_18535 [Larkinella sp. GY13]|uniref:hypothetical protein n=1 Tax=Larkinella sp. GY13 TaxID=3453720 RepID=UPI003EF05215